MHNLLKCCHIIALISSQIGSNLSKYSLDILIFSADIRQKVTTCRCNMISQLETPPKPNSVRLVFFQKFFNRIWAGNKMLAPRCSL